MWHQSRSRGRGQGASRARAGSARLAERSGPGAPCRSTGRREPSPPARQRCRARHRTLEQGAGGAGKWKSEGEGKGVGTGQYVSYIEREEKAQGRKKRKACASKQVQRHLRAESSRVESSRVESRCCLPAALLCSVEGGEDGRLTYGRVRGRLARRPRCVRLSRSTRTCGGAFSLARPSFGGRGLGAREGRGAESRCCCCCCSC